MNKISTWLFIGIISALFFACTAEKDKGDYLKGRVLLDGQPAGGVLVRLYDYPQVNDTLEYLQSQYPGIGVKVTRQLNFDKNALTVIREVYSDKNGNWEMDNLSTGSFAVVYLKDGLCKNQYGVTVGTGGSNAGDFNFGKPFIYKNDSTITGNVTWPAGSSVYIQGKIIVDEMASLTVEPGVSIAFSDSAADYPKGELAIYGKAEFVGTEENYITFSGLGELKNAWNGVKVGERAEGKFRYCAFYNGFGAILSIKSKLHFEDCLFTNNITGLNIEATKNGYFSNLAFLHNTLGMYVKPGDSIDYDYNLFYKNLTGSNIVGPGKIRFINSLFTRNGTGFVGYSSKIGGIVQNCEFQNNAFGIILSGDVMKVQKNNFRNSSGNHIRITASAYSVQSKASFNYNNFYDANGHFAHYSGDNPHDLNGANNYWNGLSDSLQIADRIFDGSDFKLNKAYLGKLLFWPPSLLEIPEAGILNRPRR